LIISGLGGILINTQRKLFKIRPPRVRITYEVETGGASEERELPFIIGIISNVYGNNKHDYYNSTFINIDKDNFNQVMESIGPNISILVNNLIQGKKGSIQCNLTFKNISDFSPDGVIVQIPECSPLLFDRVCLVDLIPKIMNNLKLKQELINIAKTGLKSNISQGIKDNTDERLNEIIGAFTRHVKGDIDIQLMITNAILNIDEVLSKQINEILHHPEFQALEARWRCLRDLVIKTETSELLRIKLLCASSDDIYLDLSTAPEFDQSRLFKLVYEDEYGTIGGIPFSCLLFDEYFERTSYDVSFLTLLSQVASAAHAPMLTGTKPGMFGLNSFSEMHIPRELARIFQASDSMEWNAFRDTEDARYVNMFLPYILARTPYSRTNMSKLFQCQEIVDGESTDHFVWGNPAYAMALKILEAVADYGWAAAVRGTEGGGLVKGLPTYTFRTKFADIGMKCPTQTQITDRREKELSDLGFIALCHKKMTDQAIFFSGQSVQNPKHYRNLDANVNGIISSRMPYILNASRFVHYIKVIIRDKIGSFQTADEIEYYIQDWVSKYVLLSDDGDQSTKARYPLREAEVLVTEIDEKPGEYDITIRLRPHFQMEGANISVRFVGKTLSN